MMGYIHIHAPKPLEVIIKKRMCPDCKDFKYSYFLTFTYEWYGPDHICMRCGRRFNDDGWVNLPFYRYARRDSKENARRLYKAIKQIKEKKWTPTQKPLSL
jgi:NMD protein affecting ribosome stability and mRNA decay